jgi:hypothetical protein
MPFSIRFFKTRRCVCVDKPILATKRVLRIIAIVQLQPFEFITAKLSVVI